MYAPFAGGLGEHAERFAGQAQAAPGGDDRNGDVRGSVLFGWLVAVDRDTALAGGFDRDQREPLRGPEPSQDYSRMFSSSTTAASVAAVLGVMPNLPGSGTAAQPCTTPACAVCHLMPA